MLEQELQHERGLFLFLNGMHSPFWDNVMYTYSYMFTWIPFYLCFFFVFAYKKHWKEIVITFVAIGLLVLFCDQLSSGIAKPLFHRFRPTHHPDFKYVVHTVFNYRGGRYGFFSGHATNSFGFATLIALMFRNKTLTITMYIFAFIMGYSRIYLGVHFVSDVVVGMIVGILVGLFIYILYTIGRKYWIKIPPKNLRKTIYSKKESNFLVRVYVIMVTIMLIFSNQIVKIIT
ncbi:MAG: phosphatase PAP2 family protein [Dysgonamonadaceae bacterium]|nr:phosphatase PAP2 family protein [Dysgonamonadaceae bacterium]